MWTNGSEKIGWSGSMGEERPSIRKKRLKRERNKASSRSEVGKSVERMKEYLTPPRSVRSPYPHALVPRVETKNH
jgi:hypothetical protein